MTADVMRFCPLFSIIIPTHDRPRQLEVCLRALARLEYPRSRFEVILVQDGGAPLDEAALQAAGEGITLTLHRQVQAGPAAARNAGAARACGDYLAFTDDDCAPAPDWLARLAERLEATPEAMVGGRTVNALTHNTFSQASQALVAHFYAYENHTPGHGFLASNNMAVPAGAFRALGGFDTHFERPAGEDRELCSRWCRAGHKIVYAPEAQVAHRHSLNLRSFWGQHVSYGRGAYQYRRRRAYLSGTAVRVEPLAFYFSLITVPFAKGVTWQAMLQAVLLMVSQVANATGFVGEWLRAHYHRRTG